MKRSRAVPLVLMGAAAAGCEDPGEAARADAPPAPTFPTEQACLDTGIFARAACGELVVPEGGAVPAAQARSYESVEACQTDDYFTDEYCTAKYEEAVELHQEHGPAYADLNACEADYGAQNCGRQSYAGGGGASSGSYWSPFFTGFLVSSALNSFNRPMPYYRDPYGDYVTYSGYGFRGGRNGYYVPRETYRTSQRLATGDTNTQRATRGSLARAPQRAQAQRTSVARRGGFGGRSGGRGG